jgi:hypothetical protein
MMVATKEADGQAGDALRLLEDAVAHYNGAPADTESEQALARLLEGLARAYVHQHAHAKAVQPLEQLVSLEPENVAALAQLVLALTYTNIGQAEQVRGPTRAMAAFPPVSVPRSLPLTQQLLLCQKFCTNMSSPSMCVCVCQYCDSLPPLQVDAQGELSIDELETAAHLRVVRRKVAASAATGPVSLESAAGAAAPVKKEHKRRKRPGQ